MNARFWITPLIGLALSGPALAQTEDIPVVKLPHAVAATAASGRWLEREPFDPKTYGLVRGICAEGSGEAEIGLYTTELSEDFFKVATAVDAYVANRPELAWSFVEVRDVRGAQRGGYKADELIARLAEIRDLAEKHGIKHLSFFVAAPGTHAAPPDKTVTLAYIRPPAKANGTTLPDWATRMPVADLQGKTLTKALATMEAAVAVKP